MIIKSEAVNLIKRGGVGVLPTDTIYGIVCSAFNEAAVRRIYKLRRRDKKKPMIILIGSLRDLGRFGIKIDKNTEKFLRAIWLGQKQRKQHTDILEYVSMLRDDVKYLDKKCPVSVVLATSDMRQATWRKKWRYLHRGTNSLAFRLPKPYWLKHLLAKVGPLVAPSANLEGMPPAKTIKEAKKYFGEKIDFFVDVGVLRSKPSKLIEIIDGKIAALRR